MRIFVTGVAGFLGSHLADALLESGHEVAGCDNLLGGYIDNVSENVIFHKADCLDLNKMIELTKGMDVVYHCAALPYEGLSVFSPFMISQSICCGSVSVITASIKNNVKRFVYMSSMARYGHNEIPFREEMAPKPQDPYGISKYATEQILKNLCQVHGMEYVIAVPHNIYGPRQKYDDPYHNVVAIMINLMLQGKQPIIHGDGSQKRCFSFVKDVVGVLTKLGFEEVAAGEVFNVGPDDEFISINELAEEIARLLDFDLNPIYVENRPMEVKFANCSADKIRRMFGFRKKTPLREGLQKMIEYISGKGPKPFNYHLNIELPNEKCPRPWIKKMF